MNIKRLVITIIVAFVTVWATDFLIHAVWLSATYGETKELWRTEAEMMTKMPWMFLGQFLVAAAFTLIFAACVAEKRCLRSSLMYVACIGVFVGGGQIIMYAVQPFPGLLVVKWCVGYLAQTLLLGCIVHFVYKPRLRLPSLLVMAGYYLHLARETIARCHPRGYQTRNDLDSASRFQ